MKTTIELPDELHRRTKAEMALSGRKLEDLVETGLKMALEAPRDSGVSDLASNVQRLAGFGRD